MLEGEGNLDHLPSKFHLRCNFLFDLWLVSERLFRGGEQPGRHMCPICYFWTNRQCRTLHIVVAFSADIFKGNHYSELSPQGSFVCFWTSHEWNHKIWVYVWFISSTYLWTTHVFASVIVHCFCYFDIPLYNYTFFQLFNCQWIILISFNKRFFASRVSKEKWLLCCFCRNC